MSQSIGKNTYLIELENSPSVVSVTADSFKIYSGFTIFFNGSDPDIKTAIGVDLETYEPIKLVPSNRIMSVTRQ